MKKEIKEMFKGLSIEEQIETLYWLLDKADLTQPLEIEEIQEKLKEIENKITTIKTPEDGKHNEEINELKNTIKSVNKILESVKAKHEEDLENIKKLFLDVDGSIARIAGICQTLTDSSVSIEGKISNIEAKNYESELQTLKGKIQLLENTTNEAVTTSNVANSNASSALSTTQTLNQTIEEIKSKISTLESKPLGKNYDQEINQIKEEIEQLSRRYVTFDILEQAIDRSREITNIKKTLEELKNKPQAKNYDEEIKKLDDRISKININGLGLKMLQNNVNNILIPKLSKLEFDMVRRENHVRDINIINNEISMLKNKLRDPKRPTEEYLEELKEKIKKINGSLWGFNLDAQPQITNDSNLEVRNGKTYIKNVEVNNVNLEHDTIKVTLKLDNRATYYYVVIPDYLYPSYCNCETLNEEFKSLSLEKPINPTKPFVNEHVLNAVYNKLDMVDGEGLYNGGYFTLLCFINPNSATVNEWDVETESYKQKFIPELDKERYLVLNFRY